MISFDIIFAQKNLPALVQKATEGEVVTITQNNRPIATITSLLPCNKIKFKRKLGTAKGLIEISPDFNDPLIDFE